MEIRAYEQIKIVRKDTWSHKRKREGDQVLAQWELALLICNSGLM